MQINLPSKVHTLSDVSNSDICAMKVELQSDLKPEVINQTSRATNNLKVDFKQEIDGLHLDMFYAQSQQQ